MFDCHAEIREVLSEVIEKFHQKGTVNPDKAISIEALDLPSSARSVWWLLKENGGFTGDIFMCPGFQSIHMALLTLFS